jgi:hypothetical protein
MTWLAGVISVARDRLKDPMRIKALKRTRAIGLTVVVMAVVAGASFLGTNAVLGTTHSNLELTALNDFSITSTISSSSNTQTSATLYPGVTRYLWYTVHNPLHEQIKVLSLSAALDPAFPLPTGATGCDASNFDLSNTSLTGTMTSPIMSVNALSTGTAEVPISLINKTGVNGNQNGCKNLTVHFKYSGTAQYAEPYSTQTGVVSTANPSITGQSVTYTATVTGLQGTQPDPLPSSPTGTVTFKDNGTAIAGCSNVGLTSTGTTTATAQCVSPVYTSPATHPITAAFTQAADLNFTSSTSPIYNQVVNPPNGCTAGPYNVIIGNPSSPTITGTNGNDFIYAAGTTNWAINGLQGSDCIQVGDGNNSITIGNANDVVVAGNGKNTINAANGNGNNTITLGNGSSQFVTLGNGTNSVTVGTGSNNSITVGNGTNTIRLTSPANANTSIQDTITAGKGTNVAYLGTGTFNKFSGGNPGNTCHLPSGNAATYHDTLTNCTVVTP